MVRTASKTGTAGHPYLLLRHRQGQQATRIDFCCVTDRNITPPVSISAGRVPVAVFGARACPVLVGPARHERALEAFKRVRRAAAGP